MIDPAVTALLDTFRSTEHCFVKRPDVEAPFRQLRDWDVVVPDIRVAAGRIASACGPPRHVIRRSYVVSLFYPWGVVDLFDRITWWGATIVPREALTAGAVDGPAGITLAAAAHEAVVAWFVALLFAGDFKERYSALVERAAAEDSELLGRTLEDAAGRPAATRLIELVRKGSVDETAKLAGGLRRAVLARALKQQPRDMVGGAAAHARRELELRASPPLPGLTVADDDAIRGACRWIADNARVATGAVLVEGRTSQLRRVEVGERPDEVASDVLARPPARIGAAALRSLRARGWVVLRREATGTRGEPDAYAALEAGLASRARTALAELGLAR